MAGSTLLAPGINQATLPPGAIGAGDTVSVSSGSANALAPVTSTPSVISSAKGAEIVAQKNQTLNQLSSSPTATTTTDTTKTATLPAGYSYTKPTSGSYSEIATPTGPAYKTSDSSKITLINPNTEQTITVENGNKDQVQQYLDAGYQVSEASGSLPDWLTPNGTVSGNSEMDKLKAAMDSAAADVKSLTDNLSKYTVSDADLAAQVQGITSLWDSRIADMQKVNASRVGSINTLGIRLGSRFAGGSGGAFGGIVSEEERQGIIRIGELEGQKQAAIAAAKTAALTQNWSVFSKQVDIAEKSYEQKVQAVKDLQEATAAQNKLIAETIRNQQTDYYNQVTKPIQEVLSDATKNGLTDPATIAQIQNAESVGEAMAYAGDYLQTGTGDVGDYLFAKRTAISNGAEPPSFDDWKAAQNAQALQTKIAEIRATEGIRFNYAVALEQAKQALATAPPPNYNGEFESTIKLAAATAGTKDARNGIQSNLQDFIANGDYNAAYGQITQVVAEKLKGTASSEFSQAVTSQAVLGDLKKAISAYAAAGGNTNIFTGKADDIQTKIGALLTNPKYAALATQLDIAFQNYRQQMTGAAFGAQESAEYASVLPDKSNTLNLNLARLEGANAFLNSKINSSIESVVGKGGVYIREKAQANNEIEQQQTADPLGVLKTAPTTSATNNNQLGI